MDIITGLTARTHIGIYLTMIDDFHSLDPRHGDGRSSNGSVFMTYNPAFRWNWQGGWSNNFKFGNFNAEIFTRFSGGNYIMNCWFTLLDLILMIHLLWVFLTELSV